MRGALGQAAEPFPASVVLPARGAAAGQYPHKYLPTGWPKARQGRRGASRHVLPLSLLFPVLVVLMISMTLQHDDNRGNVDWQAGFRIVGYGLAALSSLFALGTRRLRYSPALLLWTLVPIGIGLSALYAPDRLFSLTAGLAHLALLLFAWQLVNRHGQLSVAMAIVLIGLIIGILSIVTFYAYPDLGRSTVDTLSADPGGRMRGVTAQPNSLGSISALTVLLAVMHFRAFAPRQRVLAAVVIAIATFCLAASDSRTSIMAVALCLLFWAVCRANAALNLFAIVGMALLGSVLVALSPNIAVYLTRDGAGPDELASLNGRSRIWEVALENIRAHPLFGQGYGASNTILPVDDRLFSAALNSHNVYLELLFSGGAVLFALYVTAILVSVVRSVAGRRVEALIALLFFLVVGAAEATPYAGLPLFSAFVFYVSVALCLVRPARRQQRTASPIPNTLSGQRLTAGHSRGFPPVTNHSRAIPGHSR